MFTPLSTGSERAQDKLWDRTNSPRKNRQRAPLPSPAPAAAAASGSALAPGPSRQGGRAARAGLAGTPRLALGSGGAPRALSPASAVAAAAPASPASAATARRARRASTAAAARARRVSVAEDEGAGGWARMFFRVEGWLAGFWTRHLVLIGLPCLTVWTWVALPFPVSDPYSDDPFPDIPNWPKRPHDGGGGGEGEGGGGEDAGLPLDVNFYFFLIWYFGMYLAVALFFITNLFSLYRLNWWPSALGGRASYSLFWVTTLLAGLGAHHLDLFHLRERERDRRGPGDGDGFDWERKTFWVTLSFVAMLMPAIACFSKLRRDKRHVYRHAMPAVQYTFFEQTFRRRIPSSWLRFLWFMTCLAIACFSLIAGQAYASLFLSTLPHTSLDAGTWVWSWVITVQLLAQVSSYILASKVRSRALLFLYKFFFQLVYHVFYRNLFATVQLLSSVSVVVVFPLQMTRAWHRALQVLVGYPHTWAEHADTVAGGFYCRSLAQNVTMVGFLGWLTILHFGPNSQIYPFFKFEPTADDPYTFPLTFVASCAIWGSELASSFVARLVMRLAFGVDVSQVGLDEMREYPELVPACGWASVHVSMNILMFLIKLNFR